MNRDDGLNPYQEQTNAVMDESVDATRRIRQMAEESRQVGADTLQNLDDQGQKLDQINTNMNTIRDNVKSGERQLHEMEKCCGLCICPWNRAPSVRKEYAGKWGENEKRSMSASNAANRAINDNRSQDKEKGNFKKVFEGDDREDEMEENLDAVGDILGDLKAQATAMNDELVRQDDVIETIGSKMEDNNSRIESATKRTNVLIKKG